MAILHGLAQLPYSSETKKSVTVDQVTGDALEAFFGNRLGSSLCWLRSTNDSKVVIGELCAARVCIARVGT